jgi:NitT/TauT family transport system substrate-binding protein
VADILQYGVPGRYEGQWVVLESSGIQRPQDLKGKRLAVPALGTALDFALRAALEQHGLQATRDYTLVEVNFPNMGAMLRQGKVDASIIVPPWWITEKAKGGLRELFGPSAAMGRIQALFFAARTEFLKKHPAAAQDFLTDYLRGLRWLLNAANRPAAVDLTAKITKQDGGVIDAYFLTPTDYFRDPEAAPMWRPSSATWTTCRPRGSSRSGSRSPPTWTCPIWTRRAAASASPKGHDSL